MEILCTGIASKAIKHKTDMATAVITCQDWAHRESLKNPIKRIFFFKFKTSVRADFFLEIWNELFEEYEAHLRSSDVLSTAVSDDAVGSKENAATIVATTTTADKPASVSLKNVTRLGDCMATKLNLAEKLSKTIVGDNYDEDEDNVSYDSYNHNYSDEDDLFEQTQPTTEPLHFELKKK